MLYHKYYDEIENFKAILINQGYDIELFDEYLIELNAENDIYIPLFTDEKQLLSLEYTRLDKVKLDVVIRDIFKTGKYHAISINPNHK